MIIELQKLIDDLELRKLKANKESDELAGCDDNEVEYGFQNGLAFAFDLVAKKLTLLLNTEKASSGQNDSANGGNAM